MMNTIANKLINTAEFNNKFKQKVQAYFIHVIPFMLFNMFIMWTPFAVILYTIVPVNAVQFIQEAFIIYFFFIRPWKMVRRFVWTHIIAPTAKKIGHMMMKEKKAKQAATNDETIVIDETQDQDDDIKIVIIK